MLHILKIIMLVTLFIGFSARAAEVDVMEQILSGYDQIKEHSCPDNKKDGLRIFVSLSMPKNLLTQYDAIAKKIGAKLVMRGFKNNSFKETIKYTQKIAIEVDPVAFKKFGVTSVPSFIWFCRSC